MAAINRIGGFAEEIAGWRRWLHQHPEIGFDLPKTTGFVADRLRTSAWTKSMRMSGKAGSLQ